MKFDFSDISFADVNGYSILKEPAVGSNAERLKTGQTMNGNTSAEKFIDTFLNQSIGKTQIRDSITDFYSDLASPSTKEMNFSNQQNTADRHGRT